MTLYGPTKPFAMELLTALWKGSWRCEGPRFVNRVLGAEGPRFVNMVLGFEGPRFVNMVLGFEGPRFVAMIWGFEAVAIC